MRQNRWMLWTRGMVTATVLLVGGARSAAASEARASRYLKDALDEAGEDRGCAKRVASDLKRLRGDVEDGLSRSGTREARRELEKIEDEAADHCPRAVRSAIGKALEELDDGGESDRDRGSDRRRSARTLSVGSHIDLACVAAYEKDHAYSADQETVVKWLKHCRVFVGDVETCGEATVESDCTALAAKVYGYSMTDEADSAFSDACRAYTCEVSGASDTKTSDVDLDCLKQRQSAYSYSADAAKVGAWLSDCRAAAPKDCTKVKEVYHAGCYAAAKSALGYSITAESSHALLQACMTWEYACE